MGGPSLRTAVRASRRLPRCDEVHEQLKGQLGVWLRREQHAPEFRLDALEALRVVGLKAQHYHRRRVRRARQTETVWILDPQAVELDHLGRPRERGALLQQGDEP